MIMNLGDVSRETSPFKFIKETKYKFRYFISSK